MTLWVMLCVAFVLGWCLRGSLCAKRGGCSQLADETINELEQRIAECERVEWARRQGLIR